MDQPLPKPKSPEPLQGLSPVGLMNGVLGGQAGDWDPPAAQELEPLFPGYHDFQFIDRGGMGAVYSAVQRSLERRVAIKILPPEMGQDEAFVDRFHQEARLLARLQHPHIVAVYDFGCNPSGHLFIVMEYVEGTSLLDIMMKERLTLTKTLEVAVQICEALQFAHDHGVIHRDIKPTNILLDIWGRVRVADYGLAKLAVTNHQTTAKHRSALTMGTPGYASPEQRRGDKDLDHRADIFSLGVTLYEMLTGHLPVGMFDPPSKKVQTPAGLDKIVIKCLREKPEDRYQKASDLRAAILAEAEKMKHPLMQRTIAKRPIVSMMTSVIVGAGFIYLLDALNNEVVLKSAPGPTYLDTEHGSVVVRLNDQFSLVRLKLNWEEARRRVEQTDGIQLASIQSQDELDVIREKLKELNVAGPIWTGGLETAPNEVCEWTDGSVFDYAHWMPSAPSPAPIITEIQAKNRNTLRDKSGLTPDWIEVHNPGSVPVDLTGWHLRHFTGRYAMEARIESNYGAAHRPLVLAPGAYQIIYCIESNSENRDEPVFGFQLEAQIGRLRWSDPRGQLIQDLGKDWMSFPVDASLIYDAEERTWSWSEKPTPGVANSPAVTLFASDSVEPPTPRAVLMLPNFDCRWCLDTQRRTAWSLVRHLDK